MKAKEKKKYQEGIATQFITRTKAMKKLQLSLADFRRLCILKGVYPHEPKHRKKAGKGSTAYKVFYYKKDIQFLLHEPIIKKFRQNKIYAKRLAKAKGKQNKDTYDHLVRSWPKYKVDHIVRERYPNFVDALRDVDDALCMCNLFACLPRMYGIATRNTKLCKRLSVEFMHYIIESRSLRKVFISIKGYYYQAEIMGQTITWLVPHNFSFSNFADVDYRVMITFTKFYTTMLGFVLYRLYQSLNLHYPPKIFLEQVNTTVNSEDFPDHDQTPQYCTEDTKRHEVVACLNVPLLKQKSSIDEDDEKEDDLNLLEEEMTEEAVEAKKKRAEEEKFTKLFEGSKFFLSREVPKEQLVFVIRSFGGLVSWDSTSGLGSSYPVDDESITHQVVDRPKVDRTYISRYYIQPQWVFDCVNARLLLPLEGYLPGDVLPPHLSPFVSEEDGVYIPPERQRVLALQRGEDPGLLNNDEDFKEEDDDVSDDQNSDENEEEKFDTPKEDQDEANSEEDAEVKKPKAVITPGKIDFDIKQTAEHVAAEEKKLAVMMIPKKRRRLYSKATFRVKRQKREVEALIQKRKIIDEDLRKEKRRQKKELLQTSQNLAK